MKALHDSKCRLSGADNQIHPHKEEESQNANPAAAASGRVKNICFWAI